MLVTMFLSMWISNTAAMALMVPIVDSITQAMSSGDGDDNKDKDEDDDRKSERDMVRNIFLLSCAYSANMGGTGVITGADNITKYVPPSSLGTPANLVVLSTLEDDYGAGHPLSYATWMAFTVPLMLLNTLLAWGLFCVLIRFVTKSKTNKDGDKAKRIETVLLARCCYYSTRTART